MTFTLAQAPARGYSVKAVDDFLQRAQSAGTSLTSEDVRSAQFPLVKGGYNITEVDAALDRLEDSVSDNERREQMSRVGSDTVTAEARAIAQEILNRVARPRGKRFRRSAFFTYGYHRDDVDDFADRIREFYSGGASLSRDEVRTVTFRPRVGGYNEAQVDLLLEDLVRVMLAAR